MNKTPDLRPLLWVASAKRDFVEMPEDVVSDFGHWLFQVQKSKVPNAAKTLSDFGHWLFQVQKSKVPNAAKTLSGFGSAQIVELRKDNADSTFRAVYTVKYAEVVIILHAFQKKSKKGIETPKQDKKLIQSRIKLAEIMYRDWKEKRGKK